MIQRKSKMLLAVQIAMTAGLPYTVLCDTIFTHPTMHEGLGSFFANVPAHRPGPVDRQPKNADDARSFRSGDAMDRVGEQLPAVATTVAGLILVFLGLIFTAWTGYSDAEKKSVQSRFKRQAWILFLAFLFAILSATLGLIGVGTSHTPAWPDYAGTSLLGLSAVLMIVVAFSGLMDL